MRLSPGIGLNKKNGAECKAGLGNIRNAGHMRPAEHLNVARKQFFLG
jgi:hypothetical protein